MVSLSSLSKKERGCINDIVNNYRESDDPNKNLKKMVEQCNNTDFNNEDLLDIITVRLKELELNPSYSDILQQVDEIIQFPTEESCTYIFIFKMEKEKTKIEFSITAENILTRNKFDAAYMAATSKVPLGDSTTFRVFLAKVLSGVKVKKTERQVDVDEMGEAKDIVYRFIEGATLVDKPEETQFSSDNIWIEGKNLYVPSQTIRKILDREKLNFPLQRMRVAFDKVLIGSSKKIRTGEKTSRFWVFDVDKLGKQNIQLKMKLVHSDDEEQTQLPSQPIPTILPIPKSEEKTEVKKQEEPKTNLTLIPSSEKNNGSYNKTKVRFLESMEAYVAKDGSTIGPFQKGEVAEVPSIEITWLYKNEFAEAVLP